MLAINLTHKPSAKFVNLSFTELNYYNFNCILQLLQFYILKSLIADVDHLKYKKYNIYKTYFFFTICSLQISILLSNNSFTLLFIK